MLTTVVSNRLSPLPAPLLQRLPRPPRRPRSRGSARRHQHHRRVQRKAEEVVCLLERRTRARCATAIRYWEVKEEEQSVETDWIGIMRLGPKDRNTRNPHERICLKRFLVDPTISAYCFSSPSLAVLFRHHKRPSLYSSALSPQGVSGSRRLGRTGGRASGCSFVERI